MKNAFRAAFQMTLMAVLLLATLAAMTSCKDKFQTHSDTITSIYVITSEASVSGNGAEFIATLHGMVTDAVQNFREIYPELAEKEEIGFEYSTDSHLNNNVTTVGAMDAEGEGDDVSLWKGFKANIFPLPPSTVYYYRAFIVIDGKREYGTIYSFRTDDAMVLAVTLNTHEETLTVPGGTLRLTATVYPPAALNKAVQWSSSQESIATVNQDGLVTGVRPGKTDITVTTQEGGKTDVCHVTVKGPEPKAVDLGLSVKWADINVGAMSESDYGSFFAWGEVSTKSSYTNSNYKYHMGISSPTPPSILPASGDAASVNLGGNWRMPKREEIEALISGCTWEKATIDGMKGWKVSGNGNSIFLPFAGIWDDEWLGYNSTATYCSSTLKDVYADFCSAYALHISEDEYRIGGYVCYYGHPIRAVADK